MAKGQLRGNKEAKKPKADKPKGSVSEYKKSQGVTGQALKSAGEEILKQSSASPVAQWPKLLCCVDLADYGESSGALKSTMGGVRGFAPIVNWSERDVVVLSSRGSQASCCAASPRRATGACGSNAA